MYVIIFVSFKNKEWEQWKSSKQKTHLKQCYLKK